MNITGRALWCWIVVALVGLAFIHNSSASAAECDARQWMNFPTAGAPQDSQKLGAERFVVLKDKAKAIALGKLKAMPFYEPSADELRSAGISAHDGFRVFFVRAVALNIVGGSWMLRQDGSRLFVEYGVLTRNSVEPVCSPLAILMKETPSRIFAHAGAAS